MAKLTHFEKYEVKSSSDSELEDTFADVAGTKWNFYQVTPLYKFQYNEVKLKQYAMRLTERLSSTQNDIDVRFKASFKPMPELRLTDDLPTPINITVESPVNDNGELRSLYSAILLSCAETAMTPKQDDFTYLPLLLCKGRIKDNVHQILCQFFNSCIKKIMFAREELLFMLALATQYDSEGPGCASFSFTFPGLAYRNSVSFDIEKVALHDVWQTIHDDNLKFILKDDAIALANQCFQIIEEKYGINMGTLQLKEINFGHTFISENGVVKLSKKLANILLSYIHTRVTCFDPVFAVNPL